MFENGLFGLDSRQRYYCKVLFISLCPASAHLKLTLCDYAKTIDISCDDPLIHVTLLTITYRSNKSLMFLVLSC